MTIHIRKKINELEGNTIYVDARRVRVILEELCNELDKVTNNEPRKRVSKVPKQRD